MPKGEKTSIMRKTMKGRKVMDKISIAVPCYNEEPALDPFFAAVSAVPEPLRMHLMMWQTEKATA